MRRRDLQGCERSRSGSTHDEEDDLEQLERLGKVGVELHGAHRGVSIALSEGSQ